MHERNMPAPGEEDMGGNPLKEGILADGGWNNRMKRDESFASVKTAMDDWDNWDDVDTSEEAAPVQRTHLFIVTPQGQVHASPAVKADGRPAFHDELANAAGIPDSENRWAGHTLGYLNSDNSVDIPRHQAPFHGEQLGSLLQRHFGVPVQVPQDIAYSEGDERFENPNAYLDPATQDENQRSRLMPDAYQQDKQREQNALEALMKKKFPYYDNPFFNRGGSWVHERMHPEPSWLASSDEDFEKEAAFLAPMGEALMGGGASGLLARFGLGQVMHGVLNPGGGGSTPPPSPLPPQLPEEYLSHTAGPLDHPSSIDELGAQENDPEAVDQREVNDGDFGNAYEPSVNGVGGTNEGQPESEQGDLQLSPELHERVTMLEPLLEKYFNSPESGLNDPLIRALHEAIEAEHPGYLRTHTAAGPVMAPAQMTGQPGTGIAPAPQPASSPAGNPNGVGTCAYCGAQLQPGSPNCPQCNAATAGGGVNPQPGSPQANPPLQTPTNTGAPNYYGHTKEAFNPFKIKQMLDDPERWKPAPQEWECPCGMAVGEGNVCANCGQWTSPNPDYKQAGMMPPPGDPNAPVDPMAGGMPPGAMPAAPMPPPAPSGTQGPQTKEQFAAVAQLLVDQGRADEIPTMLENPDQYAEELAEIQNKQPVPQDLPQDNLAQEGEAPPAPDQNMPVPGMTASKEAADNIAPRCPKCGSGTTGLISEDGLFGCHACGNSWKREVVKKADLHDHEQLHPHVDAQGLPAADQLQQEDPTLEQDAAHLWQTEDGAPLKVGREYELHGGDYDIPDLIRIDEVKPDAIVYTIVGEYNLGHQVELTAEEAQMDQDTFVDVGADTENPEETNSDSRPFDSGLGQTDLSQPTSATKESFMAQCADCGGHRTTVGPNGEQRCMTCGSYNIQDTRPQAAPNDLAAFQSLPGYQRQAGKKYTPFEQRKFIDEQGEARNKDKLNLKGTHYEAAAELSDYFLW